MQKTHQELQIEQWKLSNLRSIGEKLTQLPSRNWETALSRPTYVIDLRMWAGTEIIWRNFKSHEYPRCWVKFKHKRWRCPNWGVFQSDCWKTVLYTAWEMTPHMRDLPVRSSTESNPETLEVRRQDRYIRSPEEIKSVNPAPIYIPGEDEGKEPAAYACWCAFDHWSLCEGGERSNSTKLSSALHVNAVVFAHVPCTYSIIIRKLKMKWKCSQINKSRSLPLDLPYKQCSGNPEGWEGTMP